MIGVVIRNNSPSGNCIIWCEDQRGLAFYPNEESAPRAAFDTGDLIRFDLTLECGLRRAVNPLLLESRAAAGLAAALNTKSRLAGARPGAQIIPFPARPKPVPAAQNSAGRGALG